MIKGGYNFEEYSVVLPYKQGDDINTGVAANEARALRARSHMALVSQNENMLFRNFFKKLFKNVLFRR